MDAPGAFNHGKEIVNIFPGEDITVAGHGTEEKLKSWLINKHESVGIFLFQAGQLDIYPFGHEFKEERADGIIKEDWSIILIFNKKAEADWTFQLTANGRVAGKVKG